MRIPAFAGFTWRLAGFNSRIRRSESRLEWRYAATLSYIPCARYSRGMFALSPSNSLLMSRFQVHSFFPLGLCVMCPISAKLTEVQPV